jgi:hypothetical protein
MLADFSGVIRPLYESPTIRPDSSQRVARYTVMCSSAGTTDFAGLTLILADVPLYSRHFAAFHTAFINTIEGAFRLV